jgi:hypothetical protein
MRDAPIQLRSPSGLLIEASTGSSDGVFGQFYQDYDAAFVLENEKEGRAGFVECLALNGKAYPELAARFGAFREFVLVARDGDGGPRIGGANFIAFPLQAPWASDTQLLSLNLNYVFINPPARRQGYLNRFVGDLPRVALTLFAATNAADVPPSWTAAGSAGSPPQVLVFIEQNDPYRMSPEDYELDTGYTGLDQIARIRIWSRLGARVVDFPYVQPPLSHDQAADRSLVLAVLGAGAGALSACLLHDHLRRFFGISVLKGADPSGEPSAAQQLASLATLCAGRATIPLLAPHGLERALLQCPPGTAAAPASLLHLPGVQAGH